MVLQQLHNTKQRCEVLLTEAPAKTQPITTRWPIDREPFRGR